MRIYHTPAIAAHGELPTVEAMRELCGDDRPLTTHALLGRIIQAQAIEAHEQTQVQRIGSCRDLRGILRLDVEGGTVTFDVLANFDKMGLLEDVAVYRFTETTMEMERAATMEPLAYLASKRHPSSWDLLWHLRSGDRLSDDFRKWSMDSRAGFGLTPTDAQAFAQMGEKMSALLGTLQALQMPNIALLEMATGDLTKIYTGTVPARDGEFIKRLVQAFPAAREIHNDAVRGVTPCGHTHAEP